MSRRIISFFIFAAALMAFPTWAKNEAVDSIKTSVDLNSEATLGTTTLQAGQYTLVVDAGQAKFMKGSKVVAEAPCTWKDLSNKVAYTSILTDHHRITEIDFSGKMRAIEFPSN